MTAPPHSRLHRWAPWRRAPFLALAHLVACSATPYPEVAVDLGSGRGALKPPATAAQPALRFSVAAIQSPGDTFASYSPLFERLGEHLRVRVEFVQRRSYGEVNDLLASGGLDAALLCTGGYLDLERRSPGAVELLAVSVIDGATTYRSLVVVPASSAASNIEDLRGRRFAFTDELSLSGHAYAIYLLRSLGRDPLTFFGAPLFTQSHDRSIEAVAKGVIDGAAVDSIVYDRLLQRRPALRRAIRVLHASPPLGGSPVVASTRLEPGRRAALRAALLSLHEDWRAGAALREVGIERFAIPPPRLYADAARVVEASR